VPAPTSPTRTINPSRIRPTFGDDKPAQASTCSCLSTGRPVQSHRIHRQWGLSFLINPEPLPTGRSAGSLAWAGLANSYYWIDPARGVAGVYATQILPFFDVRSVPTFQAFETEVYRAI
jgi:CubicO group peptidase (beta-lactamase class C family)